MWSHTSSQERVKIIENCMADIRECLGKLSVYTHHHVIATKSVESALRATERAFAIDRVVLFPTFHESHGKAIGVVVYHNDIAVPPGVVVPVAWDKAKRLQIVKDYCKRAAANVEML